MTRAVSAESSRGARARVALGALLLALGLGGCPGTLDPSLVDAGGSGTGGSGGSGACDAPAIFAKYTCAAISCHDANGSSAGFKMTPAGWENTLVDGNPTGLGGSACSGQGPYLMRGTTPAQGLFLRKISATPGCGARMPFGAPMFLTADELGCVQTFANGLVAAAGTGSTDAGATGQ